MDAEYLLRAGTSFITPFNLGFHPVVAPGATDSQIAHAKREHEESTREFHIFKAVDNALKKELVNAIDGIYIKDLRDCVTGFTTRSARDILQYLYQTYRLFTPTQLTANVKRFRSTYDGSTDLEAYFNGIDDCLFMADKANQPYFEGQHSLPRPAPPHNPSVSPSPYKNGINSRPWHKPGLPSKPRSSRNKTVNLTTEFPPPAHMPITPTEEPPYKLSTT